MRPIAPQLRSAHRPAADPGGDLRRRARRASGAGRGPAPGSPPAPISPTRSRSRSPPPARMARRWRGSSPSSATMSDLTPLALPATAEPVRVAVRRLRWLRTALREQLAAITAETGVAYRIDDRKLAAAFVSWLRRVEAQNPHDPERRRDFFTFAAGMMLEELIRAMPVDGRSAAAGGRPRAAGILLAGGLRLHGLLRQRAVGGACPGVRRHHRPGALLLRHPELVVVPRERSRAGRRASSASSTSSSERSPTGKCRPSSATSCASGCPLLRLE